MLGGVVGTAFGLEPVFYAAVAVVVVGQLLAMRVVTPEAAGVAQQEADRAEQAAREAAGATVGGTSHGGL